jgi:hypothetical protein
MRPTPGAQPSLADINSKLELIECRVISIEDIVTHISRG